MDLSGCSYRRLPVAQVDDTRFDDLEAELSRLKARVRNLESRLADNAIVLSEKGGKTRRVRLGKDDSMEVEV